MLVQLRESLGPVVAAALLAASFVVPWVYGVPTLAGGVLEDELLPHRDGTLLELGAYGRDGATDVAFAVPLALVPLLVLLAVALAVRPGRGLARTTATVAGTGVVAFAYLAVLHVPGNLSPGGWLGTAGALLLGWSAVRRARWSHDDHDGHRAAAGGLGAPTAGAGVGGPR